MPGTHRAPVLRVLCSRGGLAGRTVARPVVSYTRRMTNRVPIRLSATLVESARKVASGLDRSLTEQVEHWAQLGQFVEAAVSSGTVAHLKARGCDANVPELLAFADTAAGKARAIKLIRERNEFRHGGDAANVYRLDRKGKKSALKAR